MRLHLAAYAATAPGPFDPEGKGALYEALKALPLAGLEQPYWEALHRHDEAWLLERFKPGWTFVLTTLPGTMDRLKADPRFGLASKDEGGARPPWSTWKGPGARWSASTPAWAVPASWPWRCTPPLVPTPAPSASPPP